MNIELLNEPEAAAFLKPSVSMLCKMLANGTGPALVKIGVSVRYSAGGLEEFVRERTTPPTRRAA